MEEKALANEKDVMVEEILIEGEALRLMIEREKRRRTHSLYLCLHNIVYRTILAIALLLRSMESSTA